MQPEVRPGGASIGKRRDAPFDGLREASDDSVERSGPAQTSAGRQSARLATKSRRRTESSNSLEEALGRENLAPHFARGKMELQKGEKKARHEVQGAGNHKRKRQESSLDAPGGDAKSSSLANKIGKVDKEHDKYCHFCQVHPRTHPPLRFSCCSVYLG